MNQFVRQATGYFGASALALGLDFALLTLLVSRLGVPYLLAAAISFMSGTVVVYWISVRHLFEHRRLENWQHEFAVFTALGIDGLGVNLLVMYALVDGVGVHYLLAKVCAAGGTLSVNFLIRRWMLFMPNAARRHRSSGAGAEP